MLIGYDTASLPDHDLASAIRVLKSIGYQAFTIRIDAQRLSPWDASSRLPDQLARIRSELGENTPVILDTNARYLLDPLLADAPGLVDESDQRAQLRIDLIRKAITWSHSLNSATILFSSGIAPQPTDQESVLNRLASRVDGLIHDAIAARVQLAIRPRSGHVVGSIANYERLLQWMESPDALHLAGDISVMSGNGEIPVLPMLNRHLPRLSAVFMGDDAYVDIRVSATGLARAGYVGPIILNGSGNATDPISVAVSRYNLINPQGE